MEQAHGAAGTEALPQATRRLRREGWGVGLHPGRAKRRVKAQHCWRVHLPVQVLLLALEGVGALALLARVETLRVREVDGHHGDVGLPLDGAAPVSEEVLERARPALEEVCCDIAFIFLMMHFYLLQGPRALDEGRLQVLRLPHQAPGDGVHAGRALQRRLRGKPTFFIT